MTTRLLISFLCLSLLYIQGCVSESPTVPKPEPIQVEAGQRVDMMELYSAAAPVNWNDDPAPDGVRLRLFFYQKDPPNQVRTVSLNVGRVQVMIFEGQISERQIAMSTANPYRIWEFSPEQMNANYKARVAAGVTYAMQLGWETETPRSTTITLVARFLNPNGRVVYARPLSLPMPGR